MTRVRACRDQSLTESHGTIAALASLSMVARPLCTPSLYAAGGCRL